MAADEKKLSDCPPDERSNISEILEQKQIFESLPMFREFLDVVSDIVLLLNQHRQVVWASKSLIDRFQLDESALYGSRPGEILDCIHAFQNEWGCGSTEFCKTCGAAEAILIAQNDQGAVRECRITRRNNLGSLDLQVRSSSIWMQGDKYTIFVITDVSHEKRRRALERIFFHDILNMAGNIRGLSDLLKMGYADAKEEYLDLLHKSAESLVREIRHQQILAAAENKELDVQYTLMVSTEILAQTVELYRWQRRGEREIIIDSQSGQILIKTDKRLLQRVIGNMIKNAVEACEAEDTIRVGCLETDNEIEFWVHNPGVIPNDIQLQIFKRSFSTKSPDRGLGTYSIKLLTEQYLNGSVSFESNEAVGTLFKVRFPLYGEKKNENTAHDPHAAE